MTCWLIEDASTVFLKETVYHFPVVARQCWQLKVRCRSKTAETIPSSEDIATIRRRYAA
jgi:hypothetical protein